MKIFTLLIFSILLTHCSHNKILLNETSQTNIENFIFQKKELTSEEKSQIFVELKKSHFENLALEKSIYGSESEVTENLWNQLDDCKSRLVLKTPGGEKTPYFMPPRQQTLKNHTIHSKFENKNEDISHSEIKEIYQFTEKTKRQLLAQKNAYVEEVSKCESLLKEIQANPQLARTLPNDGDSEFLKQMLPDEINDYICDYVDQGASLSQLIHKGMSEGWLTEEDFLANTDINTYSIKDITGLEQSHVLKINEWSLSFSKKLKLNEVLNLDADAQLEAWMHKNKEHVKNHSQCLPERSQQWHTRRRK